MRSRSLCAPARSASARATWASRLAHVLDARAGHEQPQLRASASARSARAASQREPRVGRVDAGHLLAGADDRALVDGERARAGRHLARDGDLRRLDVARGDDRAVVVAAAAAGGGEDGEQHATRFMDALLSTGADRAPAAAARGPGAARPGASGASPRSVSSSR